MLTYDVHQHFLPPPFVEALRSRREPPCLAGSTLELGEGSFPFDESDNDLGERIARLDADGTDVAVISLGPTMETEAHPELRDAYHEGMREVLRAAEGRFHALAAGVCLEGFSGACVSAQAVVSGLGDLPGELARAGQALFVHPGPPGLAPATAPAWWAPVVDYTSQMQAAYFAWLAGGAERSPDVDVVFAVLAGGAPVQLERMRSRGAAPDAALSPRIYLDTASYGSPALRMCAESVGADRLVFGSDVPVIDAGATLHALADLGEAVVALARSTTPARLFP